MAKIFLKEPNRSVSVTVDTGETGVNITEAFLGVRFQTPEGEVLSVSMRDGGFEVHYQIDAAKWLFAEPHTDVGWFEFKDGRVVKRMPIEEKKDNPA